MECSACSMDCPTPVDGLFETMAAVLNQRVDRLSLPSLLVVPRFLSVCLNITRSAVLLVSSQLTPLTKILDPCASSPPIGSKLRSGPQLIKSILLTRRQGRIAPTHSSLPVPRAWIPRGHFARIADISAVYRDIPATETVTMMVVRVLDTFSHLAKPILTPSARLSASEPLQALSRQLAAAAVDPPPASATP